MSNSEIEMQNCYKETNRSKDEQDVDKNTK